MGPTRRPIRLPKITKYSVAVTTEGTSVWPQLRTMRPYSRITIVFKPTQRTLASGRVAEMLGTLDIAAPIHDHTHEDLLEAIYLVAHFFSSRRRHTRLVSDWSSDVCSSD